MKVLILGPPLAKLVTRLPRRRLRLALQARDRPGPVALEPALEAMSARIVGAIYTPSEDAGDCYKFCNELKRVMTGGPNPVKFRFGLSLPVTHDRGAPRISVTDFKRKVVYARLGDELRVAGMADLSGRRAAAGRAPAVPLEGFTLH